MTMNEVTLSQAMESFWLMMTDLYGNQWVSQYGHFGETPSARWLHLLNESGVTVPALASAVSFIQSERMVLPEGKYPVNYQELSSLCLNHRERMAKLPPLELAIQESVIASRNWDKHRWSCAEVYETTVKIGCVFISGASERDLLKRYAAVYDEVCRVGSTMTPPTPEVKRIEAAPKPAADAKSRIAALRQTFVVAPVEAAQSAIVGDAFDNDELSL